MNKIILDDWLSRILKRPAYSLKKFNTNLKQKDLPKGKKFIWSKVSVNDIKRLVCLENLGFYVVDTNVNFILSENINTPKTSNLRFAKQSDEKQVRALAKNAFKQSRFYKDPKIPNKIASKIK